MRTKQSDVTLLIENVMTLQDILDSINKAPTLMDLEEELEFIRKLETFSDESFIAELIVFKNILDRLFESHVGSAYFQVTKNNFSTLGKFAKRLRKLAKNEDIQGLKQYNEFLVSIADVLEMRYEDK